MLLRKQNAAPLTFLLLLPLIYAFEFWFIRQPHPPDLHTVARLAVTTDLILVLPLLFYFLVARPRRLSPLTIVPVILLAFAAAALVLPRGDQGPLILLRECLAPGELALFLWGGIKAREIARHYKRLASEAGDDVLERLRLSLEATPGVTPALRLLVLEGIVFYYGLSAWRVRPARQEGDFAYHEQSGLGGLVLGGLLLSLAEGLGTHLIVAQWSRAAAWGLTALGAYSALGMIALYQAARLRPLRLEADRLRVRVSLLWSLDIPLRDITVFRPMKRMPERRVPGLLRAALLGDPQFALHLREPLSAYGLLGIRREVRYVALAVDEPERFEQEIRKRLS